MFVYHFVDHDIGVAMLLKEEGVTEEMCIDSEEA